MAATALSEELDRSAKIAPLDSYLRELDALTLHAAMPVSIVAASPRRRVAA
ncbi:MAG TPA: hypothetical protein VGO80_07690 [Solirubrobacteraceae bacterium]|nr:hypothetical protein [Solirubrobacteraceae bacterium]